MVYISRLSYHVLLPLKYMEAMNGGYISPQCLVSISSPFMYSMDICRQFLWAIFIILATQAIVIKNGPVTCAACLEGLSLYCLGMVQAGNS